MTWTAQRRVLYKDCFVCLPVKSRAYDTIAHTAAYPSNGHSFPPWPPTMASPQQRTLEPPREGDSETAVLQKHLHYQFITVARLQYEVAMK